MILVPFFQIPHGDRLAKNVKSRCVQVIPRSTVYHDDLKSGNLLHKRGLDDSQLHTTVNLRVTILYLEPSHCPFICSIAVVASFFLTNETNPYPFDFPVTISLTTRQSLISPKGANAVLKVSVSISGDKSPTKMWWCWDVSTLPCWVPVELVAQLT